MGRLQSETMHWQPDWVIGCSDAWTACMAQRLASGACANLAVDAYDDFESYMPWNLPLHLLYRRSVRSALLVTAAGPQLAALLARHRRHPADVEVLPMAADPGFQPLDRAESRHALGLPLGVPVLGYSGAWGNARGTDMLGPAFAHVRTALPDALLALTGRPPESIVQQPGVVALGYLDDRQLPTFTNAVDVACVITSNTRFGRSSYPAKLCEAMACGTTVIATDTAPVRWMLSHAPDCLVPAGDIHAFGAAAISSVSSGQVDYGPLPTWRSVAQSFHTMLTERMTHAKG